MGYYDRPMNYKTEKQLKERSEGKGQQGKGYYEWPKPCMTEAQLKRLYNFMQSSVAEGIKGPIIFVKREIS